MLNKDKKDTYYCKAFSYMFHRLDKGKLVYGIAMAWGQDDSVL